MILDNLRKAGVQNTIKDERLKFDSLDPFAGEWIHAQGHYTREGTARSGGPRSASARNTAPSAQLVKEAAKEAVRGVGFDVLLVCGFAFDPSVSEEAKRYGKLTVLPVRMNPDLAMGDELLKKTGAGNLFMVFGEPDVDIKKQKDGKLTVVDQGPGRVRPDHRADPQLLDRRHRLLVHRHRLQRRELLRPPRLLHRRGRTLRETEAGLAGRNRRGRLVGPLFDRPAARSTRPRPARSP